MIPSSAYLLVFHGSRDRKAQSAASDLAYLLNVKFKVKNIITQQNCLENDYINFESETKTVDFTKNLLVEVAALELASLPLNESLVNFARLAHSQGYKKIKVLPLFLAPGVHVREDIPAEIALAKEKINDRLIIELSPYLGKYSAIATLLSQRFLEMSGQIRIIVAHGSRLPTVSEFYHNLASKLDANIAYWSTAPSLEQQVTKQIRLGKKKIAILPYFLFPGKITEAIAAKVAKLQTENQGVELILGQPLGASEALAELIFEEL